MINQRLPVRITPISYAEQEREFQGVMPISKMQRLMDGLPKQDPQLEAELKFGVDVEGIHYFQGTLKTDVTLVCQRCNQPVEFVFDVHFKLALVKSDVEAVNLPSYYDPLICDEDTLFLQDILEDELILGLPLVPLHQDEGCHVSLVAEASGTVAVKESVAEIQENPFAVLGSLKR